MGYARRFGLVAVSGSLYVGAVYLGLQLYGGDRKRSEKQNTSDDGVKSYVFDPRRTATFQKIAYAYDDQIEKDELVSPANEIMLYDYAHTKSGHNVAVVIQTSALC